MAGERVIALACMTPATVAGAATEAARQIGAQVDDDVEKRLERLLTLGDQEEFGGAQVKSQRGHNGSQSRLLHLPRELNDRERRMGKALGLALT
ncbi:hypothetical protein K2Z83_03150 [Oscillochloris sp. ZM17-4]|nr:hypothetical protein [Oscillochloris sp. ZM17-4]